METPFFVNMETIWMGHIPGPFGNRGNQANNITIAKVRVVVAAPFCDDLLCMVCGCLVDKVQYQYRNGSTIYNTETCDGQGTMLFHQKFLSVNHVDGDTSTEAAPQNEE